METVKRDQKLANATEPSVFSARFIQTCDCSPSRIRILSIIKKSLSLSLSLYPCAFDKCSCFQWKTRAPGVLHFHVYDSTSSMSSLRQLLRYSLHNFSVADSILSFVWKFHLSGYFVPQHQKKKIFNSDFANFRVGYLIGIYHIAIFLTKKKNLKFKKARTHTHTYPIKFQYTVNE